nr:hypothetical protein CFP56_42019 [Quercus suber]
MGKNSVSSMVINGLVFTFSLKIDQATAGVLPNDVGERNADGVEELELSKCGLGVKLDDLGIVAAESDRTAKWGVGDFIAAEIDVPPLHR